MLNSLKTLGFVGLASGVAGFFVLSCAGEIELATAALGIAIAGGGLWTVCFIASMAAGKDK